MATDDRAGIEQEMRSKAIRRVRTKLGFYWHLLCFTLVNIALVAINLHYTPAHLWFVWPLGAWGAGLVLHAFAIFSGRGVTEGMIQAEIRRELSRRGPS